MLWSQTLIDYSSQTYKLDFHHPFQSSPLPSFSQISKYLRIEPLSWQTPLPSMATTDNIDCSDGFCSIGTILSFIILLCYYTFISKYCNSLSFHSHPSIQHDGASSSNGIDEILINKIAVFRYRKAEGVIELTDCSVCLGEFREEESLRLLPKCSHVFHLQCIDTWLKSNSSFPLCRTNVLQESSKASSFSAQQEREMVVVVED